VATVVLSPLISEEDVAERTLVQTLFTSSASGVVHPNLSFSVWYISAVPHRSSISAHLSAHHLCLSLVELIVADSAPSSLVEHFHASMHSLVVNRPAQAVGVYVRTFASGHDLVVDVH